MRILGSRPNVQAIIRAFNLGISHSSFLEVLLQGKSSIGYIHNGNVLSCNTKGNFKNLFSQKVGDSFSAIIWGFFVSKWQQQLFKTGKEDYKCQRIFYLKVCQRLNRKVPISH